MPPATRKPIAPPDIDQAYERQVTDLARIEGSVTDLEGTYQLEPHQQRQPASWTPARSATEQAQAQRQATLGNLRTMIDQGNQEPAPTNTGYKFIINEETSAADRSRAAFHYFVMIAFSAPSLAIGIGLWWAWGFGIFAGIFTGIGALLLITTVILNIQAQLNSPIRIEQQQRQLDNDFRTYKEANAQEIRQQIVAGFLGQAKQDIQRNGPVTIDGQLFIDSHNNEAPRP